MAAIGVLLLLPTAASQAAAPEQLHVTLGAEDSTLVIHWALQGAEYGMMDEPEVLWSVEGGAEQSTPADHVGTVQGGGNIIDQVTGMPTRVYAATIGPVLSGANVTYRVGDADRGYSGERTVRMVPAANDSIEFVAYGDIGYDGVNDDGTATEESAPRKVRDLALAQDPDLLIIPGDLAYANSQQGWDRFMRFMEPIQATVPTMPTIGNHEWAGTIGYAQILNEYVLPGEAEHAEQAFVFHAGPATFVAMNSDRICNNEERARLGSPPRPCDDGEGGTHNESATRFLEAALSAAENDTARPWTVVFFHHPGLSWGHHGIDWAVLTYWDPLFVKYDVDVIVTGHDHLYSRSHPTVDRKPVDTDGEYAKGAGPVYVVAGGGGRSLYSMPSGQPPAWHAHGVENHHVARLRADADMLQFDALDAANGSVFDSFVIMAGGDPDEDDAGPTIPAAAPWAFAAAVAAALFAVRRRP